MLQSTSIGFEFESIYRSFRDKSWNHRFVSMVKTSITSQKTYVFKEYPDHIFNFCFLSVIFDTIDLLLLLCTDSKSLRPFLKQLSNDTWFQLFYQLTQQCNDGVGSSITSGNIHLPLTPTFDLKTMEKLGILFEKLSELPENRRLFAKYNFLYIFKEWKQKFVTDSPFLVLNMKSTLLNLEQN